MQLSQERIQELKGILEKEHGREFSWDEATEAGNTLIGLAELAISSFVEDQRRKKKLEESPKGFHLDGDYRCFICGQSASREQSWFDKYGIKCMTCQGAIDRKVIPASLAKNDESWYSRWDIESAFNVKGHVLRRWVKEGVLKARTIPCSDGKGVHVQLFLIKDNKDTLPPKKMLEGRMVKETKDGKDWYHMEPWYRFVDPYEYLKGYKIMDHLRVTDGGESKKEDHVK